MEIIFLIILLYTLWKIFSLIYVRDFYRSLLVDIRKITQVNLFTNEVYKDKGMDIEFFIILKRYDVYLKTTCEVITLFQQAKINSIGGLKNFCKKNKELMDVFNAISDYIEFCLRFGGKNAVVGATMLGAVNEEFGKSMRKLSIDGIKGKATILKYLYAKELISQEEFEKFHNEEEYQKFIKEFGIETN